MANAAKKFSSVFRPGLFNGKVAIVTGGATGIGKTITEELIFLGCKVMIASRNEERLQKAAEEMKTMIPSSSSAAIDHIQCNIRKEEQVSLLVHTGAARAGVDNITKSLSIEWAQDGVRINSVAPVETAAANYSDPEIFNRILPVLPTKRFGTTEEVSAAVCFLLSPAAAFITGETLKVDGGGSLYSTVYQIP
ncbi:hypothetical protein KUTeg_015107, partial [Tegillarca granosa]